MKFDWIQTWTSDELLLINTGDIYQNVFKWYSSKRWYGCNNEWEKQLQFVFLSITCWEIEKIQLRNTMLIRSIKTNLDNLNGFKSGDLVGHSTDPRLPSNARLIKLCLTFMYKQFAIASTIQCYIILFGGSSGTPLARTCVHRTKEQGRAGREPWMTTVTMRHLHGIMDTRMVPRWAHLHMTFHAARTCEKTKQSNAFRGLSPPDRPDILVSKE